MAGPVAFGYKGAWLAIRSTDPSAVAEELGLGALRPCGWDEGVEPGGREVFLTPPVDGWVLAIFGGTSVEDDAGGRIDFARLSSRFGEVQKFATHRVVEYHEWQLWRDGEPVRRFAYVGESGEILFDDGEPTDAEGNVVRMEELDAVMESDDESAWDRFPDETSVMKVAAAWSVDPTTLDTRDDLPSEGLLGTLASPPAS